MEFSSHRCLLRLDRSAILVGVTLPSPCTHALVACACAATLLLTACSAATATVAPSSHATAAATPTVAPQPFAGNGFRTNVPAGWQNQTTNQSDIAALSGSGGGTVLMLLTSPDDGVLVARITPQPVPDDQLAQYLGSTKLAGATDVSQPEPVDVGGESGVLITFEVAPATGSPQEDEDMVVNTAGNTYEIALSTPQADFSKDAAGLQEILDNWMWA
jgi:hypothetical protein